MKGASTAAAEHVPKRVKRNTETGLFHLNIGSNRSKELFVARLAVEEGPTCFHIQDHNNPDFASTYFVNSITAETVKKVRKKGVLKEEWVMTNKENHFFDCCRYAMALNMIYQPNNFQNIQPAHSAEPVEQSPDGPAILNHGGAGTVNKIVPAGLDFDAVIKRMAGKT